MNKNSSILITVFVLLFVNSNVIGQQYTKNKYYVDLSNLGSNPFGGYYRITDKYYVIFNTHDKLHSNDPEINSDAGHAWVMWAHEDQQRKQTEIFGYGFWPNTPVLKSETNETVAKILTGSTAIPTPLLYITSPGILIGMTQTNVGGSFGTVPGLLKTDLFGTPYSNSIKQVVFSVDKNTFENSLKVVDNYKESNPNYKLLSKDCTTFFIEVGNNMGIKMPARNLMTPNSWFPTDYMDKFISEISSPNGINLSNGGNLNVSSNGDYKANLDNTNSNYNSRSSDNNQNEIEVKYRDNKLISKQTNYPNGCSFYKEMNPPVPIALQGLGNEPVSEFTFKNGNTIFGYDPNNFNPKSVYMSLDGGKKTYDGSINQDGIPDGKGTLSESDNQLNTVSKYGTFSNGDFVNYEATPTVTPAGKNIIGGTPNGNYAYGQFKNGQLTGNGKVLCKNGDILTGNFEKGFLNGDNCTVSSANGYVSNGHFVNGKMTNGTVTLPNGSKYTGDFNEDGTPKNGHYFDKHGHEGNPHDFDRDNQSKGNSTDDFCTGHQGYHDETCGPGGLNIDH